MFLPKREWDNLFTDLLKNAILSRTSLSLLLLRVEGEEMEKILYHLDKCVRAKDAFSYWSKYLALLLNGGKAEAMKVALRIRKVLEDIGIKPRIAIAAYPQDAKNKIDMIKVVEHLLWESVYDGSFSIKTTGG